MSSVLCALALSVPVAIVDFPVALDLPQHLGQVRLFLETLGDSASPYTIQWGTPYLLGYMLPALAWLAAPPVAAGHLTLMLCALVWSIAAHGLAHAAKRQPPSAILACVPFFGVSLQWGFVSFLVGLSAFALFLIALWMSLEQPKRPMGWALLGAAALGVYATHLLWFGAAMVAAVVIAWRRRALRHTPRALVAFAPSLCLAGWSTLHVHATFTNSTVWGGLDARLSPTVWATMALGPARDGAPVVILLALVALVGLGFWQRGRPAEPHVRDLLLVAGIFAILVLLLPTRYTNTIQFNARWASPALAFLALSAPLPRWPQEWVGFAAAILLGSTAADTAGAWWRVNVVELEGLAETLEALPENPRVLGLTYLRRSQYVEGIPFLQSFAWAQVYRGGTLNFSFADFSIMPVVFKEDRSSKWTSGLEWYPERVKPHDFKQFDHVILAGPPEMHEKVSDPGSGLEPLTSAGIWRLYLVK